MKLFRVRAASHPEELQNFEPSDHPTFRVKVLGESCSNSPCNSPFPPVIIHMLGSPIDESISLEEDSRLLPSSDSRSQDGTGRGPQYRDRIADQDIELGSISSASIGIENPNSQPHQENYITSSLNSPDAPSSGLKKSAASILYALSRWVKGPRPSRPFKIEPILPRIQNIPITFLDNYFPRRKQRSCLLLIFCLLWIILFSAVLSTSISGCQIAGYHTPIRLSCVSRLW